jgi:hypothetical protein
MIDQKGSIMSQIHTKFTSEQIKVLLGSYEKGILSREEIEKTLGIGKTRFFALLKLFRENHESFTIDYQRVSNKRLDPDIEEKIRTELLRDKALIDDKDLPISGYNYAALTDRLKKDGINVSTTTIIKRAINLGCYHARKTKKALHDREVITSSVGDLIQHDASIHKWSPYVNDKWILITSLDDYSRMMLYADFVVSETSWAHIQAAQYLMQTFGVPYRYYVDNLRVFRFIQHRDSVWKNLVLGTDDVNTQWQQTLALMKTNVVFALSPQAKGKIERPYRWLQDRIVRTCALNHVSSLEDARSVLREEVHRYNFLQIHSTTQEIPAIRFENACSGNKSLFRPFVIPQPYSLAKDVFCIRHTRIADGYRKISIGGHSFQISGIVPHEDVEIHFVPDEDKSQVELRFWANNKFFHSANLPISSVEKMVHF